ncbi:type VI secretion system baseplate subunit TssF [Blastopirellula retiformator]|uniref:Type VI secretion system baseplate subunit TssF n=1 Tax=Blastopirellula retiformator TaxID=2527970 RepID=A0A5C5V4E7_9BACT|nr:type VI secretion system baseplate subunit TssF [Blastopirellula retiformator]TWT32839.1 hypothetical protein Enr8_26450 [Blastopirellula retiformator]
MNDTLFPYYERELLLARQQSQNFARKHPAAAGRLLLEANRSRDPHVERLIESFALIAGRIQKKLDDDFPEVTDALLEVLYPHYLAPIPSLATVQFQPDPTNPQVMGTKIARGSQLRTQRVGDGPCFFRTCYDSTIWPIEVAHVETHTPPWDTSIAVRRDAMAAIRLRLRCQADATFAKLPMDSLRFHLHGGDQVTAVLYEYLLNHCNRVSLVAPGDKPNAPCVNLDPHKVIQPVGFQPDEALMPSAPQGQAGYQLLTDLFAYPEKFLYFDLHGLRRAAGIGCQQEVDVWFFFDRVEPLIHGGIHTDTFQLGCVPVINLFDKICEPVSLDHRKSEYRVTPDVQRPSEVEIHSIRKVNAQTATGDVEFRPFYAVGHASSWNPASPDEAYWHLSRRPSSQPGDDGEDAFLQLVDLNFDPCRPSDAVATVHAVCSNRDLPTKLYHQWGTAEFQLQIPAPIKGTRCLRQPTPPLRPPVDNGNRWRLVSHLSLNHLSLTDIHGIDSLREILRLYDFSTDGNGHERAIRNRQMIEGVQVLTCDRTVARIGSSLKGGFCRGLEIRLELDDQKYHGIGAYLFASVLERFFGLYVNINSFTQLVAVTQQRGVLKRFEPRAGEAMLL